MQLRNFGFAMFGLLAATAACGRGGDSGDDRDVSQVEQNVLGDNDNDNVADLLDLDDDNDGILDQVECPAETLQGKEFWMMFNANLGETSNFRREVFFAGTPGTSITIDASPPTTIPPSGLLKVDVTAARDLAANVIESGKAIHIVTSAGVS